MKKYLIFMTMIMSFVEAKHNFVGRSFYSTAPITFVSSTSKYAKGDSKGAIEVSVSYIASYDSQSIRSYFSPFDKEKLTVKENMTNLNPLVDQGSQDILSYNFNLVTKDGNFESTIEFSPIKKIWSSNVVLYRQLKNNWWIAGTIPFMHMETDMRLVEKIVEGGGGASHDLTNFNIGGNYQVGTMKEAFASRNMKYGRIDGKQKKTDFSDCVLKIGREYRDNAQGHIRPFMGVVIPSSNKPTAEYMFEPVLGNGKHPGVLFGSEFGTQLASRKRYTISCGGVMQMTYLFPRNQIRSFDPAGKPWGRYMAMVANAQDMAQSRYSFGINECTKVTKSDPGIQYVSNLSFSIARDNNCCKLGYQTTVRVTGGLTVPVDWSVPGIASLSTNEANTNPARGINNLLDGFKDTSYKGIEKNEVGLTSPSHPFYIAHQLMASFITEREKNNKKYKMECGGRVTFGRSNAVPHEWAVHLAIACCV